MAQSANAERERLRWTFDRAASLYQVARPEYPDSLYDSLVSLAGLSASSDVLCEVGPASGKATLALARRGFSIVGVELGASLTAEARRNLAGFDRVTVVNADFETWQPESASHADLASGLVPNLEISGFALVFAATAWHWIDPAVRYRKAWSLLRPGGHLAFWEAVHVTPDGGDPFFREIQSVYDEIGEGLPDGWVDVRPETLPDARRDIEASGLFTDVTVRRFDWETRHTAESYLRLLDTFSGHIAMAPWQRMRLYGEIRRRLALRADGQLRRHWGTVLHVARRLSLSSRDLSL
jgi:SAM-dependent methyltransferase